MLLSMSGRSRTFAYYFRGHVFRSKPRQLQHPRPAGSSSTSAFCSSTRVFEGGNLPASEPRASRDFALVTSPSRIFAYYLRAPVTGGGLTARAPWEAPTLQSGPRGNIALFIPPV